MKTINLTKGLLSTLLLFSTSSVVLAAPNYPEDFTPEIVYQDKDYIAEHGGGSAQKQSIATPSSSSSSSSKYPEDFTPEIVYQDNEYISKSKSGSAKSNSSSASSSTASKSSSAPSSTTSDAASSETEASTSESGGMSQYLIGLVALLAAGAFLFSKRPASEGSQSSAAAPASNTVQGGGTGVANYLKRNNMAPATGVAKYLEQQVIAGASGVEKYLRSRG